MLGTGLTIFKKGVILIALPVVFQLGTLAYLLKAHEDAARADRWEIHSRNVINHADNIVLDVTEAHSAIRGMGFFHDYAFEANKRALLDNIDQHLADLRQLVSDNPQQLANVDALTTVMNEYMQWFNNVESHAKAGDWPAVDTRLDVLYGKSHVDAVQAQLRKFLRVEEQLDTQRLAAAAHSRDRQRSALVTIAALSVLLAFGLLWAFTGSISGRLAIATENARRMAEGEPLADPVQGADEIAHLDAVLHDTARRLTEATAKEKHYREELQRRAQELERTNNDLVYKTQENETFVYSVSHDMRSPLVNLQGFTQELTHACTDLRKALTSEPLPAQMRGRIDAIIDQDILTSIRFIQTAVTRSSGIIDALLRLSRAGRVQYNRQNVDLDPVIERILTAMRISLQEKHVEVRADPMPTVVADPTAVEQVFANLIGNAVNYLDPARRGRIEIGVRPPAADTNGQKVTLYVRDNGLGIPSAYLSKLFVAFQRLHGNVAAGEGVGLALVKRIVDRHGGRIWAESTEGVGTTFYVSLPRAEAPAEPAAGEASTDDGAAAGAPAISEGNHEG